jgi:LCP family protein required for cell wall assembly
MKKMKNCLLGIAVLMIAFIVLGGCGKKDAIDETEAASESSEIVTQEDDTEAVAENTEETEESQEPVDVGTFVVYFSGIDVWGWTDIQSRSDVNIIAAVNTNTRHIQLINTPRDYYVELPISNGAKDKLTHAGLYGVETSMGALEMLYGIDIDYYIRMNFSGFEAIIDAMGGVDVYSEYDFTVDPIKHYVEGYNHLTGLEALAFVRERHAFASGDNQRGRNQMALVQAMVKKVCSVDFLMNYEEIMTEITDMYRTNMETELIAALILNQVLDDSEWTVDTFSVTGTGGKEATYSAPNSVGYVMYPNADDVAEATELINAVLNETEE